LFPAIPVYEMVSLLGTLPIVPTVIKFTPVEGRPAVLAKVTTLPEPPVPKALSDNDPFKVVS